MAERPNILFLLNDHQAYYRHGWDAGPYPARPNFDRIADAGVCFDRAFTASAICVPARRTMATGMFPHNHGMLDNREERPQKDRDFWWPHLAELGYRNLYFGKWHHGLDTAQDNGCEGFSVPSYGNAYLTQEYHRYCREQGLQEAWFEVEHSFYPPHLIPQRGAFCMVGRDNYDHASGLMRTPTETCESFFLAHLAVEALRDVARSDRPWAMQVHFWGPHQPYFPSEEYAALYSAEDIPEYGSWRDDLSSKPDLYRHENNWSLRGEDGRSLVPSPMPWEDWAQVLARCYAQVTMVDAAGGLILDALDELGLADNTVVLWTTDHGDAVASHGGRFDKRSYMTEEMYRIPMALRWPGEIEPGQVCEAPVSNMDVPPTFLDVAGTSYDSRRDGRSVLPLANGGSEAWREDLMCEIHGHGETIISRLLVRDRYRYIATQGDMDELYDMVSDPFQVYNLIANPAYADVLAECRERLRSWQEATGDPEQVL